MAYKTLNQLGYDLWSVSIHRRATVVVVQEDSKDYQGYLAYPMNMYIHFRKFYFIIHLIPIAVRT